MNGEEEPAQTRAPWEVGIAACHEWKSSSIWLSSVRIRSVSFPVGPFHCPVVMSVRFCLSLSDALLLVTRLMCDLYDCDWPTDLLFKRNANLCQLLSSRAHSLVHFIFPISLFLFCHNVGPFLSVGVIWDLIIHIASGHHVFLLLVTAMLISDWFTYWMTLQTYKPLSVSLSRAQQETRKDDLKQCI
jgi:hypothetical protein